MANVSDLKIFGKLVRQAREAENLSGDGLASAIGQTNGRSFISKLEGGTQNLKSDSVRRIAKRLHIPRESVPRSLQWSIETTAAADAEHALDRIRGFRQKYFWYDLSIGSDDGWVGLYDDIELVLRQSRLNRIAVDSDELYRLAVILLELSWMTTSPKSNNRVAREHYEFVKDLFPKCESEVLRHLYFHNVLAGPNCQVRYALRQRPYAWQSSDSLAYQAEQCNEALNALDTASEGIEGWAESVSEMRAYQISNVIKTIIYQPAGFSHRTVDGLLGKQRDIAPYVQGFSKDVFASELSVVALGGQDNAVIDLLLRHREALARVRDRSFQTLLLALDMNLFALGILDEDAPSVRQITALPTASKLRFVRICRCHLLPQAICAIKIMLEQSGLLGLAHADLLGREFQASDQPS